MSNVIYNINTRFIRIYGFTPSKIILGYLSRSEDVIGLDPLHKAVDFNATITTPLILGQYINLRANIRS